MANDEEAAKRLAFKHRILAFEKEWEERDRFFDAFDEELRAAMHQVVMKHYPHFGDLPAEALLAYKKILQRGAEGFIEKVDELANVTQRRPMADDEADATTD